MRELAGIDPQVEMEIQESGYRVEVARFKNQRHEVGNRHVRIFVGIPGGVCQVEEILILDRIVGDTVMDRVEEWLVLL